MEIKLKLRSNKIPNWTWHFHDSVKSVHIGKRKTIIGYYVKRPWSITRLVLKTKDVLSIEII